VPCPLASTPTELTVPMYMYSDTLSSSERLGLDLRLRLLRQCADAPKIQQSHRGHLAQATSCDLLLSN
jgi:hypothetical protein